MNVQGALIGVILMQLAVTLKGVTPALATPDTSAMDFLAQVSSSIYNKSTLITFFCMYTSSRLLLVYTCLQHTRSSFLPVPCLQNYTQVHFMHPQ